MGGYWVHTKVQETHNEGKGREKKWVPMVDDQTHLRVRHVDDFECMISAWSVMITPRPRKILPMFFFSVLLLQRHKWNISNCFGLQLTFVFGVNYELHYKLQNWPSKLESFKLKHRDKSINSEQYDWPFLVGVFKCIVCYSAWT